MGRESKKKISFSHEVQLRLFSLFWSLIQDTCEQFLHSSFEFLCTICEAAKVEKRTYIMVLVKWLPQLLGCAMVIGL